MVQLIKTMLLILTTLFPVVNPLGGAPIFLSLTHYYSEEDRRLLSRRIATNGFILLIVSYLIGTYILAFFGISLPVVQVGGGLVVISAAWAMLNDEESVSRQEVSRSVELTGLSRKAFYPLTLPLTVGPGTISVAITLGANGPHRGLPLLYAIIGAFIGAMLIAASIFLCYSFACQSAWRHRHERYHAPLVVSAALHRCTNLMEWRLRSAEISSRAEWLIPPVAYVLALLFWKALRRSPRIEKYCSVGKE